MNTQSTNTRGEFLTKIVEVGALDGKKTQVVLENSLFHPSGGGQPGDTGTLQRDGFFKAVVTDARKHKEGSKVVLDLILSEGRPEVGM